MPVVTFDDFDACAASLRDWRLLAVQLDRGSFEAEIAESSRSSVSVAEARFSRKLHQSGDPPPGAHTLAVLGDPTQRVFWRGHWVEGGQVMLFPRGAGLDCVSEPGFHVYTISIDEEHATPVSVALTGSSYEDLIRGREVVSARPGALEAVRREAGNLARADAAAGAAVGERLLDQVLAILDDEPTGPTEAPGPARDRAVRCSLELIHAHARQSVSVAELCSQAGTSRRTLEYAFRERTGMAPKAYMLARRLGKARAELQRAASSGDSVTSVAIRWGFHHMSQFASLYRRQFGELPSATLRRGKGIAAAR